jgi:uncharacterized membrane protein YiaA
VTNLYVGLCWLSLFSACLLLMIGLWHAVLALNEKGFYAMAFVLSLFSAITIQKNVRDLEIIRHKDNF